MSLKKKAFENIVRKGGNAVQQKSKTCMLVFATKQQYCMNSAVLV